MMQHQRRLAAILFTDIVGYTAMMQKDEAMAVGVIKRYTSTLKKIITEHNGEILNDYGDGSLCVFPSATEAVNTAIELQNELQKEPVVPLRIGLHVGEIFFEDGKVFGDGVNIASRIQSLGQANMILFSSEINNKIKNHTEFKSVSIGRFEFKNVDDPVEVFALANEGFVVPKKEGLSGKLKHNDKKFQVKNLTPYLIIILVALIAVFAYKKFSGTSGSLNKEKSVAILPFKNISINKEENEPFCIGVALELQKKLEFMSGLFPIAPQSVEKFRDTKLSVNEIAKELGGVNYIIQANVQRDKDKVKVFVSLIDAASNKEIWRDDFPGEVKDIFSLQENIAQQIASALQVTITPDEQSHIGRVATKNTAAIDAYNDALTAYVRLKTAVHPLYWDSLPTNPQLYTEWNNTLSLCDKAIKTDPLMAEAYVLKGQTYIYSIYDWSPSKAKRDLVLDTVRRLAHEAIQIDNSSADACLLIARCSGSSDSAFAYLQKALVINPNNFDVNREAGTQYAWRDPEKGIRFCKKAIRLNPLSVWTPSVYENLGFAYHTCGDFEKAEFYRKKAVEMSKNSMFEIEAARSLIVTYNHWGKADSVIKYASKYVNREANFYYDIAEANCNLKNDCAKAAQQYEELWNRYKNHTHTHRWAVALMNIGKTKEAKEKLDQAINEFKERKDTLSYDYAGMCALTGDKIRALKILKQFTWDWGSPYLVQHDKLFDNIRNEKEFKEIVQRALDEKTKLREKINRMEAKGEL